MARARSRNAAPALTPRREPVQDRSRLRVARILDAAAALLDEGGLEAVTTNTIARRARLPVGTVYQFFPNKEAVLMALARARLAEMDARFQPTLLQTALRTRTSELAARVIDVLRDAYVEIPGLATLVGTTQGHPALEAVYSTHNRRIVAWVAALLQARAETMDQDDATAVGTVIVEASDAVLRNWLRRRAHGDPEGERLLAHLKAMLRAYLSTIERLETRLPSGSQRPPSDEETARRSKT